MATLLMYHLDNLKQAQIAMLCSMMRIQTRPVQKAEELLPIGTLAGKGVTGKPVKRGNFSDEMLVLVDFSEDQLDGFLHSMRVSGIAPVELKAVLTEYNRNWNAYMLYTELSKEREAIRKMMSK